MKIIQRVSIKISLFLFFKFQDKKKLLLEIGMNFFNINFFFFVFEFITSQLATHCLFKMSYRLNFFRHRRHSLNVEKVYLIFFCLKAVISTFQRTYSSVQCIVLNRNLQYHIVLGSVSFYNKLHENSCISLCPRPAFSVLLLLKRSAFSIILIIEVSKCIHFILQH